MPMKRPMVALLSQLLHALRSWLTRRAQVEAENLLLRQRLIVLRHKAPRRHPTVEHRSLADGVAPHPLRALKQELELHSGTRDDWR